MKRLLLPLMLLLGACQTPVVPSGSDNGAPGSDRYSQKQDAPPHDAGQSPQLQDPVPVAEPRSRYGNHSPYRVYGVSYHVLGNAEGYVAEGIASWYGSKFHGHRTSSGEPYDMYKLSAAHRSLPLPTWARVTNLDNGKTTLVRVNDRGPFHSERLIDLSWAAAVKLGIDKQGTGRVRVEALTPAAPSGSPPAQTIAAALPSPPPTGGLYLQVGAFRQLDSAQGLVGQLAGRFAWPVAIRTADQIYRVWIGPFATSSQRDQARQQLGSAGYADVVNASP